MDTGSKKGFTLIELLVVIAIIAILAAILFPVFAQARDKARQAACLSNTKQISLGITMYAQDYDEIMPVLGVNAQNRGRWQFQIFPYVKNVDVFTCPSIPANKWVPPPAGALGTSDRGGYGWSLALAQDTATNSNGNLAAGYALAKIAKPSETIIVGDTGFNGTDTNSVGWAMYAADPRKAPSGTMAQPGLYPQFRHHASAFKAALGGNQLPIEGRANFCFLDGHAKSLSVGQAMVTSTTNPPTEDGAILMREPPLAPNHMRSDVEYLLWNIY
jgi:prepilin-type N-terminal cleavage/methylation domain-containing protein/prepilin-type processing-associated H-X9-DG protein